MKWTSPPSSYRYCTFFVSVCTRENFSPARNVRSTTAPESRPFSFVRTNAPPLPGFTCWNSTMRQTEPSSSMCIPFRNWLVETTSATAGQSSQSRRGPGSARGRAARLRLLRQVEQVLREVREDLDPVLADDGQVL